MMLFKGRNNSARFQLQRLITRLRGNHPLRLPDFLVIGATRSGTTTLNHLIGAHPDVYIPPNRELHYFDNEALFRPDLSNYPYLFGGYNGEKHLGEVTPSYWERGAVYTRTGRIDTGIDDDAMQRISRAMPQVRLIVTLRDPMTRIQSVYLKNHFQGKISHSLEEEIAAERSGQSRLRPIARSQYHQNLQRILDFFPRENLLLLVFEEWTQDQQPAMQDIFRFIGCDPLVTLPAFASNASGRYRKTGGPAPDPALRADTRRTLIEATAQSRAYVEHLLGRPMPWVRE